MISSKSSIFTRIQRIDNILNQNKDELPLYTFIKPSDKDYFYYDKDNSKTFKSEEDIKEHLKQVAKEHHVKRASSLIINVVDNTYLSKYLYEEVETNE